MAQDSKDSSGGFPFTGLAAVVLVAIGIVIQQFPLEPTRPASSPVARESYPSLQKVPSRLWQDPFEATASAAAARNARPDAKDIAGRDATTPLSDLRTRLQEITPAQTDPCVTLMPVPVPGGPYGEYAEARRRTRYAVVSGLLRSGFAADDEDHIGYVRIHGSNAARISRLPLGVPFEWFTFKEWREAEPRPDAGRCTGRERVLLLWLDEASLSGDPITRLQDLLEHFDVDGRRIDRVRVIGPAGSGTLEAMLDELTRAAKPEGDRPSCANDGSARKWTRERYARSRTPLWTYCAPLEIYVWGATTGAKRFAQAQGADSLTSFFAQHHIALLRPIADDERVVERLGPELALRGIKLGRDPIAIVAEADTEYGRQLMEVLRAAVATAHEEARRAGDTRPLPEKPENAFFAFRYLRGLDGETGNGQRQTERSERPKDEKRRAAELEVSSGLAQLDYTKRIAVELRAQHNKLRQENFTIAAIGVLGTDFYDKALLLQALKKEMPQAVYFTTDLDARMTDANQTRWSRNLLVASGSPLALTPALQKDVAPFRDTYQTATYMSTLLALNVRLQHPSFGRTRDREGTVTVDNAAEAIKQRLQPRAYEVGRHEVFDFGPVAGAQAAQSAGCGLATLLQCPGFYPKESDFMQLKGERNISYALVLFLAVIGLAVGTSWAARQLVDATGDLLENPLALAVMLILLVLGWWALILIWYPGIDREPFRWAEGMSAWPTLILRFLALVLAVWFFYALARDHAHMQRVLAGFCLSMAPQQQPTASSMPWWLVKICSFAQGKPYLYRDMHWSIYKWVYGARYLRSPNAASANASVTAPDDSDPEKRVPVNAKKVIEEYAALAAMERRFDRVLPVFLCYVGFSVMLVLLWDLPNAPIRGSSTRLFHYALLASYIVCYGLLLFAVVDAVRLFEGLVAKLTRSVTEYCPETLARFRRELRLPARPFIDRYLSEWLDIELVARQTESTVRLVYYPFAVLAIGLIARSQIFDDWYTPVSLGIIFVLGGIYTAFATIRLRTTAERARGVAVARMGKQLIALRGRSGVDAGVVKQCETLLDEVRTTRRGAFMPLAQQPLWKAVLLPLSGFGGVELLQYLWIVQA
jgi:hypothetical protein